MAYFPDLTPHTYAPDCRPGEAVNIGWLGEGHEFETGDVPKAFVAKLAQLCSDPGWLYRGSHQCGFCPGVPKDLSDPRLGNGQICVPGGDGVWYAAPTMIHHYVTMHAYRPPQSFIDAVLAS